MKQHLLFFLILFTATIATAQFRTIANHDTIVLNYDSYYVGNQKHGYGIMYRNLGNELKVNPEATKKFNQAKKTYAKGAIILIAGAAVCLTGAFGRFENENVNLGLIAGSMPFSFTSICLFAKSKKQLKQAVHIRNQH